MHPTSQNPLVLKSLTAPDLLAFIPELIGFQPENSVVLVPFRGKRTCGAMRFDLPSRVHKSIQKKFAMQMVGTLCKLRNVDSVVVAIFSDQDVQGTKDASDLPHAEYVSVLDGKLTQAGFPTRDLLYQGPNRWGSYASQKTGDLADVTNSATLAIIRALPPHEPGSAGGPPQLVRGPVPNADEDQMKRMRSHLEKIHAASHRFADMRDEAARNGRRGDYVIPPELAPLTDLPVLFEEALTWSDSDLESRGAILLHAIREPSIRDAAMLQWASSIDVGDLSFEFSDRVHREDVHGLFEPLSDADIWAEKVVSSLMMGIGPRPDPPRVDTAIQLLRKLTARVTGTERLAPLCILGWLNWALGSGSVAGNYIDEARSIDPTYGMAELLDTMFSNGMFPEWAFNPDLPLGG